MPPIEVIIFVAICAIGFVIGLLAGKETRNKEPDGILCVSEHDGKIQANFIFCIPTGELLRKDVLKIEVKQLPSSLPDDAYSYQSQ